MKFEKSETLQCLINAFVGESQARNKYTFYAKAAKNEGYNLISEVFLETAENEREHAKLFYKEIPNGFYTPNAIYPFFMGSTYDNLLSAANAEKDEWENVYKHASQVAKTDGFDEISRLFHNISEIEKRHSHRFSVLAEQINKETLYKRKKFINGFVQNAVILILVKKRPVSVLYAAMNKAISDFIMKTFKTKKASSL